MSDRSDPRFFAWCNDTERMDAFVAALSALTLPGGLCSVSLWTRGMRDKLWRGDVRLDDVIALVRANFTTNSEVEAYVPIRLRAGWTANFAIECYGAGFDAGRYPFDPLRAGSGYTYIALRHIEVVFPEDERWVTVEAAIHAMEVQEDMADLLLRICAPDERKRVTTGGYRCPWGWGAPIELSATYNADGYVARDLALSWLHLHDGNRVGYAAGLSLDALAARVEAAPPGARVGVAVTIKHIEEHIGRDDDAARFPDERPTRFDFVRRGPRARLPGDVELTREQVLAALSTPPAALLEALEASALPDDEWRAVEPRALEMIEAKKQGAPTREADVTRAKHTRFIQQHAPYHVRRLPNGGVLLATHPYRTLWPLWADALFLLGITP
jgi:hypothetical protein